MIPFLPPLPTIGLKARQSANANLRANRIEPEPGFGAGVKRMARYLKRVPPVARNVKHPGLYLHAAARKRIVQRFAGTAA